MKHECQDDHYYAILKAIPDLMMLVEGDGTCVEVISPQTEDAGIFLPIHHHIREILPPPLLAQQLQAIASVLMTGKVVVYEHQLEKYGKLCDEEIRISPVNDHQVLILVRDITENKMAQQELTQTNLELNTAYHKLSREIDERKQIETELEQIFNLSLDLIGIAGMDGYFHKVNPAFSRILGYPPEQLLNTPFLDFVHPEDRPSTIKELEKLAVGELCIKFRNRYLCQDGSYRWLSWNATPMLPKGLIYALGRDITEQIQIEESLKESEANNRAILNAIPDCIFRFSHQGIFLDYKTAHESHLVIPPSQFLGQNVTQVLPNNIGQAIQEAIAQALVTNEIVCLEYHLPIGEEIRYYEARFTAFGDTEALAIVRNITEQKQAQQQLYQTEERLQYLLSASPSVLYSAQIQPWKTTFISNNVTFVLGYAPPIFLQQPNFLLEQIHPEDLPPILKVLPDLITQRYYSFKYRFLHGDGTYRWILDEGQLVEDNEGHPLEFVGSLIDITELQQSQSALLMSEERLKLALDAVEEGVWDWNLSTGLIYRSRQWALMLGYNPEEITPNIQTRDKLIHPEDLPKVKKELEVHLTGENPFFQYEFRMLKKSGEWCWILDRGKVIARDEQGNPLRMVGTQKDVTQRRQVELELRESEERYRLLSNLSPVGIWRTDLEGNVIDTNKQALKLMGLTAEEILATGWVRNIHPDDRVEIFTSWTKFVEQAILGEKTSYQMESRVLHPDGSTLWIFSEAVAQFDSQQQICGFIGTITDITQRKQMEDALRKSEQKYRLLVINAPVGIFQTDTQGNYLFVNQLWQKLSGLSALEALGDGWTRALSVIDRQKVLSHWSDCLVKGQPFFMEYCFQKPQGQINWVYSQAIPVRNQEGIITGFFGTITDITERKRADLELAQKNLDLEIAKAQLAESNRTLEQKVEQRTRELSETLEILKATQAKLLVENALLRDADQQSAFDYQVGGSLPLDAPTYVVRTADRHFYKAIQQGEFCYVLNTRQMGKSSLLVQMLHQLEQEGFCCAAIDLTMLGSDTVTLEQWYKGLAIQLAQKFKLLTQINFKQWWQEKADLSPVQRLSYFIEEVILVKTGLAEGKLESKLVIFFDEIDSVLGLNFPVNDFFALIRSCYNQRSLNPAYNRLTFALFGVATPSDLMDDLYRTPFNIGQAIHLKGFQLYEAQPLLQGLTAKVFDPQAVLQEVLAWTGGQPFLTQKLLQIINNSDLFIAAGKEAKYIGNLVQQRMIEDWENQDEPTHFKTIRDRILQGKIPRQRLLSLYQQILSEKQVKALGTMEEKELILSGLVIKKQELLTVNNLIYAKIFNDVWIQRNLYQFDTEQNAVCEPNP